MKLTLYPYEPFEINERLITVFGTSNTITYSKMIAGLTGKEEILKLADEQYQLIDISLGLLWCGEITTIDIEKLFQNRLLKRIEVGLTDTKRQQLITLDMQVKSAVLDVLYMYDLSLDVDAASDISRLLKYTGVHFSTDIKRDPYGIIESILMVASELNETKIITLLNVSHYLSISQFQELVRLMATLNVKLFIIEFSEKSQDQKYQDCRYYYIDDDFVEWQYQCD